MPSADQVPVINPHSTMRWHKWVVLIAGSTGCALRAVRPPNLHITPDVRRFRPSLLTRGVPRDPGGTSIRNFLKTTPCNVDFCQNQWVLPPILRRIFAHMYWAEGGRDRPQMTARNRKTGPAEKPEYLRTPREAAALDKFRKGRAERSPSVKPVKRGDHSSIVPDHPDEATGSFLVMEPLGTTDLDFFNALLSQLGNAGSKCSEIDEQGINFMLSIIKGIKPRDQIEAMLAAQMP